MTTPAIDNAWRSRIVGAADVAPADLRANPANWRTHPRRQREALRGSLDTVGWVQQVLVNRTTGNVVDGHARLEEALRRKEPTIPVLYVELEPDEEELVLATLDPIAGMAIADQAKLAELVAGIVVDDDALRALLNGLNDDPKEGATDPDALPDFDKWGDKEIYVQAGDLWELGDHRIHCADALEPASWTRLMGGRKAGLVHTDPPYGVSYNSPSGKHDAIANDALTGDGLADFLAIALTRLVENAEPNAAFYIWHATGTRDAFAWAMKRAGLVERQYLLWVKPSPTLGHADYQQAHEPCFYANRDGFEPAFYGDRAQATVWQMAARAGTGKGAAIGNGLVLADGEGRSLYIQAQPPKARKIRTIRIAPGEELELGSPGAESDAWFIARDHKPLHPTQKPTEIPLRAMRNSSRIGDVVVDPFGGSGSTLIAAEQLDRAAFLLELDPRYVQLTIERWQDFTGRQARKIA